MTNSFDDVLQPDWHRDKELETLRAEIERLRAYLHKIIDEFNCMKSESDSDGLHNAIRAAMRGEGD